MSEHSIFEFDEEQGTGSGSESDSESEYGGRDRAELEELLGSISLDFLQLLAGNDRESLRYENVGAVAEGWSAGMLELAMTGILDAAARLGWITDATLGPDAWESFLDEWPDPEAFEGRSSSYGDDGAAAAYARSAAVSIRGRVLFPSETGGSRSFEETLEADRISRHGKQLVSHVYLTEVDPVERETFRGPVVDGRVHTHDRRYRIDSGGQKMRYLISVEDGGAVLYLDQRMSERDARQVGPVGIERYPSLQSHAQIDGSIVCAGDVVMEDGKVVAIDNHSGSYQPSGRNLAALLRLTHELGILSEGTAFFQFVSHGNAYDPDDGELGRLCSAEVWARLQKTLRREAF
ncbi:hypothetical protein [Streptomyces sp. WAC06614]|uniref:hypothetical protein n=1 Tax=Streptomyces sp. WAC06614 TaxID=2487416 RepID=UPI000F7812AB|nr:hypothetical protein [Streptomyces sp. WAC06614]RSS81243.1 hypothetical protein EF918_11015 [Streptomyces sp. WAC06614]